MSPSSSDQGLVPGQFCLLSLPILVQHFSVMTDGLNQGLADRGWCCSEPLVVKPSRFTKMNPHGLFEEYLLPLQTPFFVQC